MAAADFIGPAPTSLGELRPDVAEWVRTAGVMCDDVALRDTLRNVWHVSGDELIVALDLAADVRRARNGHQTIGSQPVPGLVAGGAFVFDEPATVEAVWGSGDAVAWAAGEGLMIVGPQGVGKTTLMQQLALGRVGLREHVLAIAIEQDPRPVLYVAADRPRQVARSFRRMVDDQDRETLDNRLRVIKGQLPALLSDDRDVLRRLAVELEVGTVFVDSLKDVVVELSRDDVGGRVNLALQAVLAEGVEVCVGHHQRKATGDNKRPDKLSDVYGSTWLTGGQGSVLLLWGDPGDPIVELRHLKQPAEEIGPYQVAHDHTRGISTLHEPPELRALLHDRGAHGLTAHDAAAAIFGTPAPGRNEIEKARRRLNTLAADGTAERIPSITAGDPDRWVYNGGRQQKLET